MAVVQISRIQIRRGQKNQGSGIPQLAGGELGWAVDSRELFIGNGSVAEGAPAVGNTKVITQHDDLFTLADTYTYLGGQTVQTGTSSTSPISRTLQSRLDEKVSIRAFGAGGDGLDQTVQIQRAIDQLYINSSTKGTEASRVTLHFPAGVYKTSATIYVPPYASIVGEGSGKTKFEHIGSGPLFQTVNSTSTPGNYADDSSSTTLNQATNILMEGFNITTTSTSAVAIKLQSCKMSNFKNIKITGPWTTGTTPVLTNRAIELDALSTVVTTQRNKFDHIMIDGFSVGVGSDDDCNNNHFHCSYFDNCGHGVQFGNGTVLGAQGQLTGPSNNNFSQCQFSDIDKEAIASLKGTGNVSSHNIFTRVGCVGGTEATAQFPIIEFTDAGNRSIEDYFTRTKDLSYGQAFINSAVYKSEIKGRVSASLGFHKIAVATENTATTIFRLPGDFSRIYKVEYSYNSAAFNAQRIGVMEIQLDKGNNAINMIDDYNYQGDSAYENNLVLSAELIDVDSANGVDTIAIKMLNYTSSDTAEITFKISLQS